MPVHTFAQYGRGLLLMSLQIRRVYEAPHKDDGLRVLVDRLWPRGLTKEAAAIDQWCRDCAPSSELRKWFDHDRAKWVEFRRRYFAELASREEFLEPIRTQSGSERVTLLYAAKDMQCNHALALMEYLSATAPHASRN
jgi:uncharacterized protein YeaO (DUF488 family)